jgi:branched-subunit amino acid ABC-type transport system permease component
VTIAFGLAGGFAAVAAIAAAPSATFSPDTGTLIGLKGLVAAVVIAFSSPLRAFVVGLALGVFEAAIAGFSIAGATLGPEWSEVLPIGLALVWIAVRRSGRPLEAE